MAGWLVSSAAVVVVVVVAKKTGQANGYAIKYLIAMSLLSSPRLGAIALHPMFERANCVGLGWVGNVIH